MKARRLPGALALLTAGAVALTGCGAAPAGAAYQAIPAAAGALAEPPSAVTAAVTAPTKKLKLGAKGKAVVWMQKRLRELGYRPGRIDGRYGGTTLAAVWAFQKVNGITPTSTIGATTWRALERPRLPKVLAANGRKTRAEVNLTSQIMTLYVNGELKLISHMSSGSGVPYCETTVWQGKEQRFCGSATTPTGTFKTTWRRDGWHKSYLGELYNPIFFNGGIAFHGALSVPLHPASHGCVRLPMNVAEELPGLLGTGVPVHVRGKFRR
ncbi:L,D-transpeptidase family protein [Nonomuraea sp. MCN248]|uniref:L,D-transpeptidase family protein n=1 Tax=Nonomuraea corallina TaxID=2989783 RepID=A0ABT4SKL8_9ACTN|nr:L,D-transpeptidase family protein [Nonomuraea corallina]MDA0637761.1 L,D-transpeptidase family protein [Nonomuraea corallina]